MASRHSAIYVLVTALLVAFASTAYAAQYVVSTQNRQFCCTNPPVFIIGAPAKNMGFFTVPAMGVPLEGNLTPPLASQTGTAIKVGMGQVAVYNSMFFVPDLPPISLKTNSGTFSVSNDSGTFQKNGGHQVATSMGYFSFCPRKVGPGPGACTNAGNADPTYMNGRIKISPGPNKFGGTMQILAGPGGVGGSKFFVYRYLGGSMMSAPPGAPIMITLLDAVVGASMVGYAINVPAPIMTGFKSTGFMMASIPSAGLELAGAGKFTTGMVTLQVTQNGNPPVRSVAVAGYDNRVSGIGKIQLVSGLLFNATKNPAPGSNLEAWTMNINFIPEPSPSLGLAAGAFGLLAVGLINARRRR